MNDGKNKKKLKSRILSAALILIGIVLVFVGYLAMQQLLQRRQERLLSQSGETRTASDEEMDAEDGEPDKLTADELEDILVRIAFVGETNPHEPYGRQMTMQEAIETGQAWIDSFCAKYAYPNADGTVSYEGISAALYTGQMNRELLDIMMQTAEEPQTNTASDTPQTDAGNDEDVGSAQTDAESDADSAQADVESDAENSDVPTDAENETEAGDEQTDAENETEAGDLPMDANETESSSQTDNGEAAETETDSGFQPGVELTEDSGGKLAESMYGYWELTFSGNDMDITLRMNAVTGQVLYVSMECSSYTVSAEELPLDSILQEYAESFELGTIENVATDSAEEDTFARRCTAEYKGEILFVIDSYVYDAAELGYPVDSGYTQSGFTMYVGVGY